MDFLEATEMIPYPRESLVTVFLRDRRVVLKNLELVVSLETPFSREIFAEDLSAYLDQSQS